MSKLQKLKPHLLAIAEILEYKKIDKLVWESKFGTRYLSTIGGFVLDTDKNRGSLNIQFVEL